MLLRKRKNRDRLIKVSLYFGVLVAFFLTSPLIADQPFVSKSASLIKGIVFDCDGILVDSEELKFLAWKEVLEQEGISFSLDEYIPLIGHTGKFILANVCKNHGVELSSSYVDKKNEIYRVLQKERIHPIPSIFRIVNWVKEKKERGELVLGVASSAGKREVIFNLDYLGITDLFDVVLSGKEDLLKYNDPEGTNKPKPYIYLEACSQLGIKPQECLVFEDTEAGVKAAKMAGCQVIALPTQWTESQNFDLADYVFHENTEKVLELMHCLIRAPRT